MPDYKSMYFSLFNRVTDAIALLQEAQREMENMYLESADDAETEAARIHAYTQKTNRFQ